MLERELVHLATDTISNNAVTIQASRDGLASFLSTAEKGFHATSQLFGEMNEVENSITSEVLSTYLGLLALAVSNGKIEFLLDQSIPFMRAYLSAQGEEDANKEELGVMTAALNGYKEEITRERDKPVEIAGSATVH